MPVFSCSPSDLQTDANCSDKGGILAVFVADEQDIDFDTMDGPLYYDDANYAIIQWALAGGGEFAEFQFERRNGRLDSNYTREDGFYTVDVTDLIFRGHSATKTVAIGNMIGCCGIVGQVHDNNALARVFGKEYDTAFVNPLDKGVIQNHNDTHGGFGDEEDKSRDVISLRALHSNPIMYSTVSLTTMRTL
jgi:hypothetical protein